MSATGLSPGVDDFDTGVAELAGVPRDHGKPPRGRRGGKEGVRARDRRAPRRDQRSDLGPGSARRRTPSATAIVLTDRECGDIQKA